jgi:tellurite resistance protein
MKSSLVSLSAFQPSQIRAGSFSVVMGLGGLSIAWQRAEALFGLNPAFGAGAGLAAAVVFVFLAAAYLGKVGAHFAAFQLEFSDPAALPLLGAIPISMEVLAVAFVNHHPVVAETLLLGAMPLQMLVLGAMVRQWFGGEALDAKSLSPTWFIPCVGGVLVALCGPQLGYTAPAWFFLGLGLLLWLFLMPILLARLILLGPLPGPMRPAIMILLPPPTLGMVAYVTMTGQLDALAIALFSFALFVAAVLVTLVGHLTAHRFSLAWWGFSFPTAALSGACSFMAAQTGVASTRHLALGCVTLCTLVILGLLARTVLAILRREPLH